MFLQLIAGPLEQIAIPTGDDCGLVDETACVQPGDGEFVVPEESTLLHCVEGGGGRHDDDDDDDVLVHATSVVVVVLLSVRERSTRG